MKVTAFIRETSAKNNITDQAHVYFRVRDGKLTSRLSASYPSILIIGARNGRVTRHVWLL